MQKVKCSVIHLGILTQSDELLAAHCPQGQRRPAPINKTRSTSLHLDSVSPAGLLFEHVDDIFHQQVPLQPVDSVTVQ